MCSGNEVTISHVRRWAALLLSELRDVSGAWEKLVGGLTELDADIRKRPQTVEVGNAGRVSFDEFAVVGLDVDDITDWLGAGLSERAVNHLRLNALYISGKVSASVLKSGWATPPLCFGTYSEEWIKDENGIAVASATASDGGCSVTVNAHITYRRDPTQPHLLRIVTECVWGVVDQDEDAVSGWLRG